MVYRAECLICHQIDGTNSIRHLVAGKSRELLLRQVHELDRWAYMPPFHGTETEMKALVEYLLTLYQGEQYRPPPADYVASSVGDILAARAQVIAAELTARGREVRP